MRRAAWVAALAAGLVACGGAAQSRSVAAMNEMEQVRGAPGSKEGAALAPQEFQLAEQMRALAKKADHDGDDVAAGLYADRAIAAYNHALVLARMARAQNDLADATKKRDEANEQLRTITAQREGLERDADALEKQVEVAREMLLPAPSGPADPAREAARRVAARALATQARLLCGSARLLSPQVAGLAEADQALADLDKKLGQTTGPAPIDDAARARAACLHVLTVARRSSPGQDAGAAGAGDTDADALLAQLSATGGWDPSRDERGVIVTLRDVFQGTTVAPAADAKLKDLGRVAAAHPRFAVQVVVHDATAPSPTEAAADKQRAEAVVKALVAAGANVALTKGETAGAEAPVVDPNDAKERARNARVEIVFITPAA